MKRRHRKLHRIMTVALALISTILLLFAYRQRLEAPVADPVDLSAGSLP